MQKAFSVSLANMVFSLNEDAYHILEIYLKKMKAYFSRNPDGEEIMQDIEYSIGSKFSQKLSSAKQVITLEDVQEVIAEMGDIKDFSNEDQISTQIQVEENKEVDTSKKKLFRDTENKVISGVCAGIAAYFGVDMVWVRLAFAISLFTPLNGFTVPLYFILWIAMPEAKTSVDKLQMQGKPLTISSIEKSVKDRFGTPDEKGETLLVKIVLFPFRVIAGLLPLFQKIGSVGLNVVAVFLVILAATLVAAQTVSFSMLAFAPQSPYIDAPFQNFPQSPVEYTIVGISYLLILMVLAFIIILAISIIKRRYILNTMGSITLLFVWIILFSVGSSLVAANLPQLRNKFQNSVRSEKKYTVEPFNNIEMGGAKQIVVKPGDRYAVTIVGPQSEINQTNVFVKDSTLYAERQNPFKICIFCFSQGVTVEITTPEVEKVEFSGATTATITGFTSDTFTADVSGASHLALENNTFRKVSMSVSGASHLYVEGESEELDAILSGASELSGEEYRVNDVDIKASGASDARIHAIDTLDVQLSGSSDLEYSGNPKVNTNTSGSSEVRKVDYESEEMQE